MTIDNRPTRTDRSSQDNDDVGVGPHPMPWPNDPRLDPDLLANGDRRNVVDRYRYWKVEAVLEDLDKRRHPFHVAIENWRHDFNIGSVVRNANAFGARSVHIIGRRRWNRRGAMMTELYQHIARHESLGSLCELSSRENLCIVGIDNIPGSTSIHDSDVPRSCIFLFGQEGSGLSLEARQASDTILSIPQYGSTRSINAGAASAIAMYEWCRRHA